ncbi:MAG TPA: glycosyl hydrolase [Ginsengibacter sp.]|nr:glycosyl hydrolase [Ginsengibacter sp.]HRP44520.1 glycosyl hydrolase [Ginsengibacter sp.]
MKNKGLIRVSLAFIIVTALASWTKSHQHQPEEATSSLPLPIRGFNQNWSFLPDITTDLKQNLLALKPDMIRYPGGTVTHKWDWREGWVPGRNNSVKHPLSHLAELSSYTNTKVMFDLDIVNSTVEDQIELLQTAEGLGIEIKYLELGNELFLKSNFPDIFPTGTEYATRVAAWVPALKAAYPNAKIAACLNGKTPGGADTRGLQWNNKVLTQLSALGVELDAYTFHIYIQPTQTFQNRITDFENVKGAIQSQITGKEIWVTEYGNQKQPTEPEYYTELEALADYVEGFADISLNHTIIAANPPGDKLNADGSGFVPEGIMYKNRRILQDSTSIPCN